MSQKTATLKQAPENRTASKSKMFATNSGEISTSFFEEESVASSLGTRARTDLNAVVEEDEDEEDTQNTFGTGVTAGMVHFEVVKNSKNNSIQEFEPRSPEHEGEDEERSDTDAARSGCCVFCVPKQKSMEAKEKDLERKFEDRTIVPLFLCPALILLQNIWDVVKHCSGLFNGYAALPHVTVGLFFIVFVHLLMLTCLHLLQTKRWTSSMYVTLRQKRNALWWYFLISALTSEIVDLVCGAYSIAQPHLLVVIAGIASFGQQRFVDEIILYAYILIIHVTTTLLLLVVVWLAVKEGDVPGASDWSAPYTNEYWTVRKRWSTVPAILIFIAMSSWMSYVGHKLHRQELLIRARASKLMRIWRDRLEFTDIVLGTSLPAEIVKRIDMARNTNVYVGVADHCSQASVSFIKLVGISEAFRLYSTVEAVGLLGKIYKQLDHLTDQHHIEKIKTIGDTYMSVCGVPIPRVDHAQMMAQFCFSAVEVIQQFSKALSQKSSGSPIDIVSKIGLACGPLVAGVIGRKNFTYDIWGDAVNTASRMYSSGKKGRIQTTTLMESKLSSQFELQLRGVVQIKGKGEMTTYWLVRPFEHLTENLLHRQRRNVVLGHLNKFNQRGGSGSDSEMSMNQRNRATSVVPHITRQHLIRVKSEVMMDDDEGDDEYSLPSAVNNHTRIDTLDSITEVYEVLDVNDLHSEPEDDFVEKKKEIEGKGVKEMKEMKEKKENVIDLERPRGGGERKEERNRRSVQQNVAGISPKPKALIKQSSAGSTPLSISNVTRARSGTVGTTPRGKKSRRKSVVLTYEPENETSAPSSPEESETKVSRRSSNRRGSMNSEIGGGDGGDGGSTSFISTTDRGNNLGTMTSFEYGDLASPARSSSNDIPSSNLSMQNRPNGMAGGAEKREEMFENELFDDTELEFLRLYRCCDRSQSHEVYTMDDDFIRYRNTTLRHYLQTTWLCIMLVWLLVSRVFESTLSLYLEAEHLVFAQDLAMFLIGPSFLLFLLIHAKNAHSDWKIAVRQNGSGGDSSNSQTGQRDEGDGDSNRGGGGGVAEDIDNTFQTKRHIQKQRIKWTTACHWCGGPRGKCCVWMRQHVLVRCIQCLCCYVCFPPGTSRLEQRRAKTANDLPSTTTRMQGLVAAAVRGATKGGPTEKERGSPIRCCCLGDVDAFSRVQMSRFLVWCSMLMMSIGFAIQAAYVDVVYSYFMFIILILLNQFSSLSHSDEVMLTLMVIFFYNVLVSAPLSCCHDPVYNQTIQCETSTFDWCSRKAVDSIRLTALYSYKELQKTRNATLSSGTGHVGITSLSLIAGSSIMSRKPSSSPFEGAWLLTFNLDRLFPVLFLVLACGRIGGQRARKLFLHHKHVAKQQEMIIAETQRHEDLLTLPKEIWHLNTSNVNRVIDSYGSILFADIVSFTVFSTIVSPMELVLVLNEMFQLFDKAAVSYMMF